jgi:hypothetical protein
MSQAPNALKVPNDSRGLSCGRFPDPFRQVARGRWDPGWQGNLRQPADIYVLARHCRRPDGMAERLFPGSLTRDSTASVAARRPPKSSHIGAIPDVKLRQTKAAVPRFLIRRGLTIGPILRGPGCFLACSQTHLRGTQITPFGTIGQPRWRPGCRP